jgi:GDP-L-fucose synthase
VAGGSGFLGKYVAAALAAMGGETIPLSRKDGFDFRNEALTLQAVMIHRPDMIVDVSGPSGGIKSLASRPAFAFKDAMQIGMNLVHAAAVAKVRLVAIGTPASYPSEGPAMFRESGFWNGYPNQYVAHYGIARKAILAMMQAYKAQHSLQFAYLVPATVYGPADHFDGHRASVLAAMIRRFIHAVEDKDEQVVCWGKPEIVRSFLFAADFARAVAIACSSGLDYPDVINLPGAGEVTLGKLAELVAAETGFTGKIAWDPSQPTGAPRRILDGRVAKKLLGWEPEVPLETGLKTTIRWYRENGPQEE